MLSKTLQPSDLNTNMERLFVTSTSKEVTLYSFAIQPAIEKALNRKMRPRYFSLIIVILRNRRGTYIICNFDGTLAHTPTAVFQIVSYFTHESIDLPDLKQHIDISVAWLRELKATTMPDSDNHGMLESLDYSNGYDGPYFHNEEDIPFWAR